MKVPSEERATQVFKQLFIDGTPEEIAREVERIKTGQSILDGVRDQSRSPGRDAWPGGSPTPRPDDELDPRGRAALAAGPGLGVEAQAEGASQTLTDDYHTDLRTLDRERQWFDLVHLALQTDSTRVIALWIWSYGRIDLPGVAIGHHDATHHGQDESKIRQLATIEEAEMALFAGLLGKMKATDENGSSLLDRTVVFYGSNLGNASAPHSCDNLPILLAGGGFQHAGHVAFDRKDNKPLSNLFVRMLHQMDVEADRFGSSTGTLGAV